MEHIGFRADPFLTIRARYHGYQRSPIGNHHPDPAVFQNKPVLFLSGGHFADGIHLCRIQGYSSQGLKIHQKECRLFARHGRKHLSIRCACPAAEPGIHWNGPCHPVRGRIEDRDPLASRTECLQRLHRSMHGFSLDREQVLSCLLIDFRNG